MKKNTLFRRLAALALAVLLSVPAMAVTAAPAGAKELFRWEAVPNAEPMMEQISDNLRRDASDRTKTHYIQNAALYTADGLQPKVPIYFLYNGLSDAYGLPFAERNSMTKITESLYLTPTKMEPISTAGLAAVNVSVVCGLRTSPTSPDDSAHAVGKFDVQVSLDGETFLETGAGERSWKLAGAGKTTTNTQFMLFELQSENLLDIPGVKPGDTIKKIRVRPHGKHTHTWGWFLLSSITVNGYATKSEWETAVPDGHTDLLPVGEARMREITLAQCRRIMNEEWTADESIYADCPSGTKGQFFTTVPGVTYHGPIYERPIKGDHETFLLHMKDGKYVGGRTTDDLAGMDCTVFAYDAYSRVSRSSSFILWKFADDNSLYMLNHPKTDGCPMFADTDVIALNDDKTIYEGYAMLKPGDVLATYNTSGGIHVRVVERVDVVRNADGSIDPNASKAYYMEQTNGIRYYYKVQGGALANVTLNSPEEYYNFLKNNPHTELLYGASTRDGSQTFAYLLSTSYLAYRPMEYDRGSIEALDAQFLMQPADGQNIRSGFVGAAATDYYMNWVRTKLEDLGTGEVLFEEEYLPMLQDKYCYNLYSEKLDAILANLTNGSYRISMSVQAGPVTEPGAARPVTAGNYDFTLTDKAPTVQVTLNAGTSFPKGQNVDVSVNVSGAYDSADVEIKYDAGKLAFVSGTCAGTFHSVTDDKGLVHVIAAGAGAGRLASLTFTAKADCVAADVLEIKSAALSTAAGAMSSAIKATDGEGYASVGFADVMKNAWYRPAVDYVYANGVMSGYGPTTFGPDNTLTRAMVVQVLYNKEKKPGVDAQNPFKDIAAGQWYYDAVRWGAAKNVVAGYGGGVFKPDDNVTLEQVAVILHNYSGKPASSGDAAGLGAHSDWAEPALRWAVEKGIFAGMPDFSVTGPATRAQTAQMLTNYLAH